MATDRYDIAVKVAPHYLHDAASGKKTFTVRKYYRPYSAGKILRAYIPGFDGVFCDFRITYLLEASDFPDGIKKGYCVLGVFPISSEEHRRNIMTICAVLSKINIKLNFSINEKEYVSAPSTKSASKKWARIWYEKARKIHDLTSGKGEANDGL